MSQSIEMAVWIDIPMLQSIEISFKTDMTVSQTIEIASGEILLCYNREISLFGVI